MNNSFSRYEQSIKEQVLEHLSKCDVQFYINSQVPNHPDIIRIIKRSIPYSRQYRAIIEHVDLCIYKVTIVEKYWTCKQLIIDFLTCLYVLGLICFLVQSIFATKA